MFGKTKVGIMSANNEKRINNNAAQQKDLKNEKNRLLRAAENEKKRLKKEEKNLKNYKKRLEEAQKKEIKRRMNAKEVANRAARYGNGNSAQRTFSNGSSYMVY